MNGNVTVVDGLYERQGIKIVLRPEGAVNVPPGELPEPGDDLLAVMGEPSFTVALETPVASDEALPAEVGAALGRACDRLYHVQPDGSEDADRDLHVEWVSGPTVVEGVVEIRLDTDDKGYTRPMVDTVARILVEELTPLGVTAHVGAAGMPSGA